MSERIDLEFQRVICKVHGEPFRAKWPAGYLIFSLKAFDALLADDDFQKEAGGMESKINFLLSKKAICCRLKPDVLLKMYFEAAESARTTEGTTLWVTNSCRMCGLVAPGCSIQVTDHRLRRLDFDHVCLPCFTQQPTQRW